MYKLAELPKEDISMFGYADGGFASGVAIEHADNVNYFDWEYTSNHCVMPELYWDGESKQLQVSLHLFSGTGFSADALHVLQEFETMHMEDHCVGMAE